MGWSEAMVDRLAALKLTGLDFDSCWAIALRENVPFGREHRGELTLLSDPRETDPVEFLRRACEDAWHGRRPVLRHLEPALRDLSGTITMHRVSGRLIAL